MTLPALALFLAGLNPVLGGYLFMGALFILGCLLLYVVARGLDEYLRDLAGRPKEK